MKSHIHINIFLIIKIPEFVSTLYIEFAIPLFIVINEYISTVFFLIVILIFFFYFII